MTDGPNPSSETATPPEGAPRWTLRVCIVAPPPEVADGQSAQAASLIARLERAPGIQARLTPTNVRLWAPFRWLGHIPYVRTLVNQLCYVPSLLSRLRRADVVHVFATSDRSFALAPLPALRIAKLYGRRTVLHFHGREADAHLSRSRRTVISRLADRILVPSRGLVEQFAKLGLEARATPSPERATERGDDPFRETYSSDAVTGAWSSVYRDLIGTPLRVCMVAPTTRILGGQAVQAERLRKRLASVENVEVRLLPVNPELSRPLRWLQRIKFVRTMVTETRYVWTLFFALRKADVAHIFSASYFSFLLAPTPALMIARLLGRRTVLNYRSGEADDHLTRWKRTAIPTVRLADRVIVGSAYLVEVFGKHGLAADVIPNIVNIDRYTFRERPRLRPRFLVNRNFEVHYNVGDVLRAFGLVRKEYPEARLAVVGDGPQRAALERLSEELELTGVTFLGQVAPEDMPELFGEADIYMNASLIDNMPTSLIEAFAAGTPVVTYATGGIPQIVDHERTGLMVPPTDFEALAAGALRLLGDPGFALDMTRRARAECVDRYTWPVVLGQWLEAYRELTLGTTSVATTNQSVDPPAGAPSPMSLANP